MFIASYGAMKLVFIASVLAGAAFAVIDPTTKGYIIAGCIAAIPPTVTGFFNHWKISTVERKVDGMNSELRAEKKQAVAELVDTSKQLSHAEGRREGIESTEDKPK
jgi:hypothetical protein